MTVFDLLLAVVFLGTVGAVLTAGINLLRGKRAAALAVLRGTAAAVAVYLGVVVLVSLVSKPRRVSMGDPQCSDDWCLTVTGARRTRDGATDRLSVTFLVASCAGRVAQREHGVVVYARDRDGSRFDPEPPGAEAPFDVRLEPLASVVTTRVFRVPAEARDLDLVVAREGWRRFPGCFIIGDENSLLHERSAVILE